MQDNSPKMTYYARVIDNVTNGLIMDYTNLDKSNTWYYGRCNGLEGGESQYIIEFDIWNNEPAWNGGMYDVQTSDAEHCRLTVWPDKELSYKNVSLNPLFNLKNEDGTDVYFMNVRCTTFGYDKPFEGVKCNQTYNYIDGNKVIPKENDTRSIIRGSGDHAIIQTKIILPANSGLGTTRGSFVLAFYYDYQ